MSYTVLARRYRSTGFDQVVGQEPITRTLKNAISSGRVAHAYLFTGTRGVGKTSMARILATALNAPDTIDGCPKLPDETSYPSVEIQQRMATAIMAGDDLNVIEIDGASNRSVEEARQLIANAALAPTSHARFKIYIIDEVHMLTPPAFNTLLKTMEEPPSHVKFILCTTESHKVPTTIQSRCQRFDFRNIPTPAIADHLASILKSENIAAQKQVVWQVARLGNGSMRDALSLLDRLIAASGLAISTGPIDGDHELTTQLLEQMLGLPDQDMINSLVDTLAEGNVNSALQLTSQLLARGIAQDQLIEVLIERLRQLMLIVACGPDSELVELSDDARTVAEAQSQKFDAAGIVYMIALCENLQRSSKTSANPRALLDVVMVRLTLAEKMADVAALLASNGRSSPTTRGGKTPVLAKQPQPIPVTKKKHPAELTPVPPSDTPSATESWASLLESIGNKPSMAWAHHLTPVRFDTTAFHITPRPGHRDMIGFVTASRCQQLADLLKPILGKPIRVQLDTATPDILPAPENVPQTRNSSRVNGRQPATQGTDRALAMKLPLVKQVLEVFDTTMVAVSRPTGANTPPHEPDPSPNHAKN